MAGEIPLTVTLPVFTVGSTFTVYCILTYILLSTMPKIKNIKPVHILFLSVLLGLIEQFIGVVSYVGWFHDAPCHQRKASNALYFTSYYLQDLFLIVKMNTLLSTNITSSESILSKDIVKKVLLASMYTLWIASVGLAYAVTGSVNFLPNGCAPLLFGTTAGYLRAAFVTIEAVINLVTSFVFFFILRDNRRGFSSGTVGTMSSNKSSNLAYKLEQRSVISAVLGSIVIIIGGFVLVGVNAGAFNIVEIYIEHAVISALLVYSNVLSKKSEKIKTATQLHSSANPSTTNNSTAKNSEVKKPLTDSVATASYV